MLGKFKRFSQVKHGLVKVQNICFNHKNYVCINVMVYILTKKLKSADPIIQLEVEAQKHTIQQIRQFNKLQIYQKEYNQALAQRKNQDLDHDDSYTPSWF